MALALTMRKGYDVFVGHQKVVVSEVDTALKFTVRKSDGEEITLHTNKWQEVFPRVFMQAGIPRDQTGELVRLVIAAPQEVRILRGDLYRRAQSKRRNENGNGTDSTGG